MKKLECTFCGKSESEVKKLIAGVGGYICDECAVLSLMIMQDEGIIEYIILPPGSSSSRKKLKEIGLRKGALLGDIITELRKLGEEIRALESEIHFLKWLGREGGAREKGEVLVKKLLFLRGESGERKI